MGGVALHGAEVNLANTPFLGNISASMHYGPRFKPTAVYYLPNNGLESVFECIVNTC